MDEFKKSEPINYGGQNFFSWIEGSVPFDKESFKAKILVVAQLVADEYLKFLLLNEAGKKALVEKGIVMIITQSDIKEEDAEQFQIQLVKNIGKHFISENAKNNAKNKELVLQTVEVQNCPALYIPYKKVFSGKNGLLPSDLFPSHSEAKIVVKQNDIFLRMRFNFD